MRLKEETRKGLAAYVRLTDVIVTENVDSIEFSTPQETWCYRYAEDVDTFVKYELDKMWELVELKQIEREMWENAWKGVE